MEALGTLAGGIAHDFNNLLMAIQGRASLVGLALDPGSPHLEHTREIEGLVKSAADLTKQLLGFARGGKYEVKPIDPNALVDKTGQMFGRTHKEITVHTKLHQEAWIVQADSTQIEQVLLNLYVNAWQAMPGGGNLYLETQNVVLDGSYVRPHNVEPGNYLKLSVTDTGVGMDGKTQARIFEPFFTTKKLGRGTGLGLASAYGIIKNHGGIINVYSEKGRGTTFNIYLPAAKKTGSGKVEDPEATYKMARGNGTILIVDDEDAVREVSAQMLQQLGYETLTAAGGKEALAVYRGNRDKIRAVVLDLTMPEMSGVETFDRLKEIDPKAKVLLASGYNLDKRTNEILERGYSGFIHKPFDMRDFSLKLKEVLETSAT
jgi:CheY-like chemotaxis protein